MTNNLVMQNSAQKKATQPWLASWKWDLLLIISPAFIASSLVLLFRDQFNNYEHLPLWAWVSFVLLVDVAHVYSTLFRTYLDPSAFSKNKTLLLMIPFACWLVGAILYSIGGLVFWSSLAYLAVFHFIRQQYGFMALYSRREPELFKKLRWVDGLAIYMATIYPLLYWHTNLPRNFNWFIAGDFIGSMPKMANEIGLVLYVIVGTVYLLKEVYLVKSSGYLNIPKNLIVVGTALTWWVGIVSLNSDLAFTMTNVLAHGIPYMALIWLYHHHPKKKTAFSGAKKYLETFRATLLSHVPAFLIFLFILAYLEEGIWDGFIWREHLTFFSAFKNLPELTDPALLAVLIPFLALPQSTHYVLDGFIWRIKDKDSVWTA